MKLKKILAMITVAVFMLAMVVVPASAEYTTVIAPQDATVAPGAEVEVKINLTYAGGGGSFNVTYDPADLTYVADSLEVLTEKPSASNANVVAGEAGTLRVNFYEDGLSFSDEAVFAITFTAKETIEGASETTTVAAAAHSIGLIDEEMLTIDPATIDFAEATITISLLPTAPVATDVEIRDEEGEALEADPMVGETLKVVYNYDDVNGDEQEGTTFQWYADEVAIEGATDETYTLTAAELGKAITVGVTPANAEEKGDEGVEAVSETATQPVVVNPALKATIAEDSLAITPADKIKVGKEVVVSYELVSPNGGEDESLIAWTGTDAEGHELELVGDVSDDGKTFTPDKEDKDKYIKVTVTPKDSLTDENEEGKVELISVVAVTKTSNNVSAFVPNAGGTLVQKTEEPTETTEPTDAPAAGIEKFTDVPADAYAWAVEGIDALVKEGIIVGVTDTTFEPETKTTRAHFVAMVMRAVEAIDENAVATYADLAEDHWGYAEIASAQALGALDIFGETIDADKVITREEMASVLYEVAAALEIELPATAAAEEFSDAASIADAAKEAVTALQQAGIINGMGDGTFMPKGETTRAQAAKVVYLLWKLA